MPGKLAPASLLVDIPSTCERILVPVPLPAVTAKTDARVAFVKDEAAIITANGRIDAGRNCVADLRTGYGGPAPPKAKAKKAKP